MNAQLPPNPLMPALDAGESYDILIARAVELSAHAVAAAQGGDSIDALLYAQAAEQLCKAAERCLKVMYGDKVH